MNLPKKKKKKIKNLKIHVDCNQGDRKLMTDKDRRETDSLN